MRLPHFARAAGLWLALLAFALKGLVPMGYMLSAHAGTAMVVLCTSQGAMVVALDDESAPQPTQQDQSCAFAMAAHAGPAPSLISLAAPLAVSLVHTASPAPEASHADHTGPPLPARGPPQYA